MDSSSHPTSPYEYVDFELEIRERSQGGYCVCVLNSPGGQPEKEMRYPFGDKPNLEKRVEELEVALFWPGETRSSSKTRRRGRSLDEQTTEDHAFDEQTVQEFGRNLFGALLDGEVLASYRWSWHKAREQNKGLRLKLRVEPPEFAQLPWEFLYDPEYDQYLCLSRNRPLVRYLRLAHPVEPLLVKPPLRILGMVANPSDPELDELDVDREKRLVGEATKELQKKGLLELHWVDGGTLDALEEEMLRGPWHVFHFIGHGKIDSPKGEGAIFLEDEEGRKHLLGARNLATLLTNEFALRLVFLNSCEGARSSVGDAFSSSATTLVRQGVPAVVAMQYEISDPAATAFARSFYREIARGLPVDAAVAGGRTSLNNMAGHTLEWGTPVLYMRSPDGRVFDVSTKRGEDPRQRYLDAVKVVWADKELTEGEAEWLGELVVECGLSSSAAAEIEREVMDVTKEDVFKRQEPDGKETVKVPDLAGQGRSEANSVLTAASLKLGNQEEAPNDTAPEGEIIGQYPEAATEAEPGSLVSVTVSSGPTTAEVPNLAGRNRSEARSALAAVSLELGSQNAAPSDTAPEGEIVGQDPAPQAKVKRGTTVSITVSLGRREGPQQQGQQQQRQQQGSQQQRQATVPNLVGRRLPRARSELEGAGLKLGGENKAPSDTAPEGEIVGQFPVARTKAERNTHVRVTVSSGPQQRLSQPGSQHGRQVIVPNLVGRRLSQARSELEGAGLKLGGKNKAPSDTAPEGEIVGQFPVARTKAERNTHVRVTVSSGRREGPQQQGQQQQRQQQGSQQQRQATVPNLVGRRLPRARSELEGAGLKLGGENRAPSDTAPEGEIVGQKPAPQAKVKRGTSVRVTLSSGPKQAADSGVSGRSKVAWVLVTLIVLLALIALLITVLAALQ